MNEENVKLEKTVSFKGVYLLVGLVILLFGLIVFILVKSSDQIAQIQRDYEELQEIQFKQDSVMNTMEDVFDEIQYNLIFVQERRGQLAIENGEGYKDSRQQIVEDVKLMDRVLHESEARIKELQEQLKKSGMAIPAYERRISALQETIRQQNANIIDLQQVVAVQDFKLSDLKNRITAMDMRLAMQKDSIATQVEMLRESERKRYIGYVAYGTTKELKSKNLIVKDGAILGIGGSKELPADFDQDYFMEIDMRDVAQISLHAKKAELITQHPSSSYHFEEQDGEVKFLSIDDPKEFWKLSRFVVVVVK
ncbi:MAG: hypothetical protein ACK5LR_06445 [Mangrovibacterium sp.]